jgi:hypothetical protein
MGMGISFRAGFGIILLAMTAGLGARSIAAQDNAASPVRAEAAVNAVATSRVSDQVADPALGESVRALQQQLKELQSAMADMRKEVDESRAEAHSLRQDFEAMQRTPKGLRVEAVAAPRATNSETANAGGPADFTGMTMEESSLNPSPSAQSMPLSAQQPNAPPIDQLTQRVGQLEDDQTLLAAKVDEQQQTKVESASKYHVRLSGIVLTNVFSNSAAVDNEDVPSLAVPSNLSGTNGSVGATLRQSELGLDVTGPTLAGARTQGSVQFDFSGGFPDTQNGVTAGLVRLRTAVVRLDWDNTSLVAGQDTLFFAPLQPTSLASLAIPALAYAGNLWTWTPQVAVEHRVNFSGGSGLSLEAGLLDALDGEPPYNSYYREPSAGESSRQPAYAGHVSWSYPAFGRAIRLGIGGYYSRQNWGYDRNVDGWAGTADALVPLPARLELSGEFYRGRSVGGLGGGVGQSVIFSGPQDTASTIIQGLNSAGGWAQLKFRATSRMEFNVDYGIDSPFAAQLREFPGWGDYDNSSSVTRNRQYFANAIFRPRSDLVMSLEYRRLHTIYFPEDRYTANVISLSMGVLF